MTAKATKGTAGNTEGQWRSGYGVKVSVDTIICLLKEYRRHLEKTAINIPLTFGTMNSYIAVPSSR